MEGGDGDEEGEEGGGGEVKRQEEARKRVWAEESAVEWKERWKGEKRMRQGLEGELAGARVAHGSRPSSSWEPAPAAEEPAPAAEEPAPAAEEAAPAAEVLLAAARPKRMAAPAVEEAASAAEAPAPTAEEAAPAAQAKWGGGAHHYRHPPRQCRCLSPEGSGERICAGKNEGF